MYNHPVSKHCSPSPLLFSVDFPEPHSSVTSCSGKTAITSELIKQYSKNIVGVHLSENSIDPAISNRALNHLPVEEFGIKVLERLREVGWDGNVTLEYLQQYHDRLIPDRTLWKAMQKEPKNIIRLGDICCSK